MFTCSVDSIKGKQSVNIYHFRIMNCFWFHIKYVEVCGWNQTKHEPDPVPGWAPSWRQVQWAEPAAVVRWVQRRPRWTASSEPRHFLSERHEMRIRPEEKYNLNVLSGLNLESLNLSSSCSSSSSCFLPVIKIFSSSPCFTIFIYFWIWLQ